MKKFILALMMLVFTSGAYAVEPVFNYIDSDWVEPLTQDMTFFWNMYGLQETGFNYYSAAGGEGYWERFNPLNDRYQAWFGIYMVDNFEFKQEWSRRCKKKEKSAQRTIDLMVSDMGAWLAHLGHPNAFAVTTVIPESVYFYKSRKGWYEVNFIMNSASDFGGTYNVEETPFCPDYSFYSDLVDSYQDIVVYCKMRFKYSKRFNKFMAMYSCTIKWQLKDGTWKYPTKKVIREIDRMMNNISFK